jgi:Zn-dependent protease
MMDLAGIAYQISVWALPVIIAITFHEAAHGWMAERLGDDTARRLGRVTLNPVKHVDPFGTIILPGLLLLLRAPFIFGYAKPVPVAFHRLNNPKRDMIWVALAGPGMNILLALVSAFGLRYAMYLPDFAVGWAAANLERSILINVILAVFNMLPIPPLDGGRVLTGLLPMPYAARFARIERYGFLILIALLFLVPLIGQQLGLHISPLAAVLLPPVNFIIALIAGLVGLS